MATSRAGSEIALLRGEWRVSEHALVTWNEERLQIHSLASGAVLMTEDPEIVRLVHAFARPRTVDDVVQELGATAKDRWLAWIVDLVKADVLIPAAVADDDARRWDWSALAYHRRSRRPLAGKAGAREASTDAAPASSAAIPLAREFAGLGGEFTRALDARRSRREWPGGAVSFDAFSELLWLSARDRMPADEGGAGGVVPYELSRPYPSGGAAYSLEIYPVIGKEAVDGLEAGLYRYRPRYHALEPISRTPADCVPFLESAASAAGSSLPPVVLLITSRFALPSDIYGPLAYALVLKEVGCLFQTLYLVAEYLGLGACALGGGTPGGRFARVVGVGDLAEPVVGEFMLGPR